VSYEHTQSGWPVRIAFGLVAVVFIAMIAVPPLDQPLPTAALIGGAVLAGGLGLGWGRMTIRIDRERLHWWYGPGWPRYSLPLDQIRAVEVTRTTWLQGWGIHRTRRGWLYNVSGYDAVHITRADGKGVLLGTDEPRRLKSALMRATGRKSAA
jgi:hypothetical protein